MDNPVREMAGAMEFVEINATTTAAIAASKDETAVQLRKRRKKRTLSNIVILGVLGGYNSQ